MFTIHFLLELNYVSSELVGDLRTDHYASRLCSDTTDDALYVKVSHARSTNIAQDELPSGTIAFVEGIASPARGIYHLKIDAHHISTQTKSRIPAGMGAINITGVIHNTYHLGRRLLTIETEKTYNSSWFLGINMRHFSDESFECLHRGTHVHISARFAWLDETSDGTAFLPVFEADVIKDVTPFSVNRPHYPNAHHPRLASREPVPRHPDVAIPVKLESALDDECKAKARRVAKDSPSVPSTPRPQTRTGARRHAIDWSETPDSTPGRSGSPTRSTPTTRRATNADDVDRSLKGSRKRKADVIKLEGGSDAADRQSPSISRAKRLDTKGKAKA